VTRIAFAFPGQAAQRPDMAAAWADTPYDGVFDQVGRAAGLDLRNLANDADACARSTAVAQPAIFATSMAVLDALVDAGVTPDVVAGHSLGELTAAVAVGVFDRDDAAALVVERGRAMGDACAATPGAMAAVIRLDDEGVGRLVRTHDVSIANTNAPGQTVVSGDPDAIDALALTVRELGGRLMPLRVEGAFHSPAMAPAMVRLDAALRRTDLADPAVPVVSGTDGLPRHSADAVAHALVDGVLAPVRWVDVQHALAAMVDVVVEVGPGEILKGCARRTIPDVPFFTVATPDDVEALLPQLAAVAPDLTPATA
jgi:[acyl-carrier-protein] S-malonyltransferase